MCVCLKTGVVNKPMPSAKAHRKGSAKGPRKASAKGSHKGSAKGPRKGSAKAPRKASVKVPRKGSAKASAKGSRKGSPRSRVYFTVHDGGKPFKVLLRAGTVEVYARDPSSGQYLRRVLEPRPYRRVWVGTDPANLDTWGPGNSLLLELPNGAYMFIGERIDTFRLAPGDTIVAYKSPIGSSAAPYPYAVGRQFAYLMIEPVAVDLTQNPAAAADPYEAYYGPRRANRKAKPAGVRPLAKTVLVPRV